MNALTTSPAVASGGVSVPRGQPSLLAGTGGLVAPVVAWWLTRAWSGWAVMWVVATTEFFSVKLLTLSGFTRAAPPVRVASYLVLWPGMDAATFLGLDGRKSFLRPTLTEWTFAAAKLLGGALAFVWAINHAATVSPMVL